MDHVDHYTEYELLAPVPSFHLESGLDALREHRGVLFGSDAFELFWELETLRKGKPVRVWIYESHADPKPVVSWVGTLRGIVSSDNRPKLAKFRHMRPKSTETDGAFALFWRLSALERLEKPFAISELYGRGKNKQFRSDFTPRGPLLVEPRGR